MQKILQLKDLVKHNLIIFIFIEIALGLSAIVFPIKIVAVLLLGLPAILILLLRPFWAYILGVILLPVWSITWTGAAQISGAVDIRFADIFFIVGILGLMLKMASDRDFQFTGSTMDFPLLLLFTWMVLSLSWTSDLSAGIVDFIKKLYGLTLFYLTVNLARNRRNIDIILKVWILTGIIWSIAAIIELVDIGLAKSAILIEKYGVISHWGAGVRSAALAENPNKLGTILSFSLLIAFAQYAISQKRWSKIILFVAILMMLLALISTLSRTTWAAVFLASILLVIWVKNIRKLITALGITAILLLFAVLTSSYRDVLLQRLTGIISPVQTPDYIPRLNIYAVGLKMFADYPLNGVGVGSFHLLARSYGSIELDAPHNIFIYMLSEFGLIGLGLFFFLIIRFMTLMTHALSKVSGNGKIVLYSLSATMAFYLLQGQIISSRLGETSMWALLGLAMAAIRIFCSEPLPTPELSAQKKGTS
jgi:O-antigen ligase